MSVQIRDQEHFLHNSWLEWIIIWLIVVEVFIGIVEVLGIVMGLDK